MAGLNDQNLFNSLNSFASSDVSYHLITTDHPYMATIGLNVFTTGQLYSWMSQKSSNGEFTNLKFIDGLNYKPLEPNETVENRILDGKMGNFISQESTGCDKYPDWMTFFKWEKKDRTGEYVKTKYTNWTYGSYAFSNIGFESYTNFGIELRKIGGPYDPNYNLYTYEQKHIDDIISIFITLNDQSRYLPALRDFYSNPNNLPLSWRASHEFIMDVKASQEKCIQWTTQIPFVTYIGSTRCIKNECVDFKLYLYDATSPNNPNRPIALNSENLYIALPRQDALGRLSFNDGTGDFDLPNVDDDPANKVIGQLDISINPATGKVEAGSKNILVKLLNDLPAATWSDVQTNETVEQELSPKRAHAPGLGVAIPIQEQNGNPLQWASQYAKQKCNNEDNKKFTIKIQNHYDSPFASGAMGYATKLAGSTYWAFIPIGDYSGKFDNTPKNWSFTYLMMNFDNFFRTRPKGQRDNNSVFENHYKYNTDLYEESVWRTYYNNFSSPSNPELFTRYLDNFPPLQITSWDFMSPSIGGLRDKNALSVTVYGLNNDGESWPDVGRKRGVYSTPFFGCTFPAGYDLNGKYDAYKNGVSENLIVRQSVETDIEGKTNKPFIKDISKNTVIFNNNLNDADATRSESVDGTNVLFNQGIFATGALETTLNHLPADIALNASATGNLIGSPLINHYHIYEAFQATNFNQTNPTGIISYDAYQQKIDKIIGPNYNNKSIWIHPSGRPEKSVFNFTPINGYKIQFRPLRHEVYDAFQNLNAANTNLRRFAVAAAQYQTSKTMPISRDVLSRNTWFTKQWAYTSAPAQDGMLTLYEDPNPTNEKSLRYNKFLANTKRLLGINAGRKMPLFWESNWLSNQKQGSGAVGVIGTTCTIALQRSVSFEASYLIGVASSFGIGNVTNGKNWYSAFGGDGNDYYSLHNTQLYLRIYQHWPKEYTIYDPAKFAVFHFNTDDDTLNTVSYKYSAEINGQAQLVDLPNDSNIYSDRIYVNNNVIFVPLETQSNSNRKRKLLPHNYQINSTIGINLTGIAIENSGTGYKTTDTFKVTGGNGTSPILTPTINNEGGITGFQYLNSSDRGYNYRQSDFVAFGSSAGGLEIVPITATGNGFKGKARTGIGTSSPLLTDKKPEYIGEKYIQLTPDVPPVDDPTSTIVEPLSGSNKVTVQLQANKMSKDGLYDLFFHFHNDTSHTLIERTYGADGGDALENYVELTILPD